MFLGLVVAGAVLMFIPWVGYPAVVVAMAGARRARARRDRTTRSTGEGPHPTVTCVLATRDAPEVVRDRVTDFLCQEYPDGFLDVVVAVDHASEASWTALASLGLADTLGTRVTVVRGDAPGGKCATLNAAVRAAQGEVLVFSDAHQRFAPDAVRKLIDALVGDPRLGATSGRLVLPVDDASSVFRLYSRYELTLRDAEARLHSAVGVSGSIYAMRRRLWSPLPAGLILDDLFVPMQLVLDGWRVGFVPDAFAFETRRVNAGQEFRRKVRTLTGNYQLCAWLPAVLLPYRNAIWGAFVCHKLLRLLLPLSVALITIGSAGLAWRYASDRPGTGTTVAACVAAIGALWAWRGQHVIARKLRSIVVQLATMQVAAAVAAVHGMRGRWDVWKV
jgi:cellulose synthase/poly-beta-1,6-N-acetylglucosamine synthase-like glycosyltransferase